MIEKEVVFRSEGLRLSGSLVDPGNLERMAGLVTAPFESHVLPGVTHLLRSEVGPGGISVYKKQVQKPVDARVFELIIAWLNRQIEPEMSAGFS
jgi:hypothetical protein